jgi:hypothetical protein
MYFAALMLLASTLVLRTGERIVVDGPVTERNGVVIFRSGGALYSMPAFEVDETATKAANEVADQPPARRLKVSSAERDRLLKELERNHSGQAPTEQRWETAALPAPREEANSSEEWNWRQRARGYEEAVRQAKENLDLLLDRADQLRSEISGLLSLGWKPESFTYQSTQLAYTQAAIPGAQLAVTRAERAYDQFRDDARRQGVMPGWLR